MIEDEIVSLYNKTKKQLQTLLEDLTFANFYRALQSGKRTYLLKNSLITKGIDSEWVDAIKTAIPHLDAIVNNPRKYMKRETDVVPIEKARVVDDESVRHLASHTNLINSIDNGMVKPNKILSAYNEESLELYENRFVATLITRVSQFIDRRYFLLGAGGREFSSIVKADGEFEQAGEITEYSISMSVKQGADYFDGGVSSKVYEDLFMIRKYANSFRYSPYMKVMNTYPEVHAPIIKTNLLSKDPHYRACIELWEFIENYNKAGYKIEIEDSTPILARELADDFDAINMMQYVALKKKMGEFDPRRRVMAKCEKRVIKPEFEEFEATDGEKITRDMGGGSFLQGDMRKNGGDDESLVKEALLRALRQEAVKQEMAEKQRQEQDEKMKNVLKNAMEQEDGHKQAELQRAKELESSIRSALKEESDRAKELLREESKRAQPAMRVLRRSLNRIENDKDASLAQQKLEDRQNDQLMKAVLNDLLRIEQEREYQRVSPLVIEGGERMPVPINSQREVMTLDNVDYYTKMFTPPVITEPSDWEDIKSEFKRGKTRRTPDELEDAIVGALELEKRRARNAKRAEARAKEKVLAAEQALKLAQEEQQALQLAQQKQALKLEKEKQLQDNIIASGNKTDNTPHSASSGADKSGHGGANADKAGHGGNSIEEEELGFWRRLIKKIVEWWENK